MSGATVAASAQPCGEPPAAIRDITAVRFYTDAKSTIADPAMVAQNRDSLRALDLVLSRIIDQADLWLNRADEAAAACALRWLEQAARGGTMLGTMSSRQAGYERKWRTAGIAIAWIKLRKRAEAGTSATVETWLKDLANRVIADESKARTINNHRYWAGLAATAVGYGTGDVALKAYGRAAFETAMSHIAADGHLPAELARAQMATQYHHYAVAPLIVAAEIAHLHGDDWYGGEGSPIHRLAAYAVNASTNPEAMARAADAAQKPVSHNLSGWQLFYNRRFPGRMAAASLPAKVRYPWLGGDLRGMASAWVK